MTHRIDAAAPIDARARAQLGFDALYDEQRRAIELSVAGRDVLVVMPTGSGKSAIYQLTGELRTGATIVVSPLLSLQHDQLTSIGESRLSRATVINSLLSRRDYREALAHVASGAVEFVFVAPEQLAKDDVVDAVRRAGVSLFVVDEAHCISMWGHDFRSEYLRLGEIAQTLGRAPILALTATAAPPVRAEIVDRLGMRDPVVVTRGFDRPEIDLRVERFSHRGTKLDAVVSDVMHHEGSGIVYVATRGNATKVAAALRDHGVTADPYHGALPRRERTRVHEQFLDGHTRVVAATNAFGMGIDKPDVRFVFHFDVPGSLDAYYQEIGRAARDGGDADAKLLYDPRDLGVQRFFAGGQPDPGQFETVLAAVGRTKLPASPTRIADEAGVGRTRGVAIVDALARADALARDRRGRISRVSAADVSVAVAAAIAEEEARARTERSRVEMMRLYAETRWCRRAVLLGYYGDDLTPPCGRCDNCRAGFVDPSDSSSEYDVGMPVVHDEWGNGVVMLVLSDTLVVLFDDFGYRTLSIEVIEERELLAARSP